MKLPRFMLTAVAVGLVSAAATPSFGQSVVENFGGITGPISGTTGGTGFTGGFVGQNPGDVAAGTINSTGLNFGNLATSGGGFTTAGNGAAAFRTLQTPINTDAGTVFTSFLASATGTQLPDFAGLSFFSNGTGTEELFLGVPFLQQNFGFDVSGVQGGSMGVTGAPVSTTPSLLVFRLDFTPTGETLSFFNNPTPGQPLPATPIATFAIPEGAFADTLTALRFASGGGGQTFNFDEVRIGSTFAQVAPVVPEPATLGLLSLGGLLMLRRRRA